MLAFLNNVDDKYIHLFFIGTFFKDNKLIYVFNISLVNDIVFDLYKVSALPKHLRNNEYVFVQPKTQILGVDNVKQNYVNLNTDGLKSCKCVKRDIYICKQTTPVYHIYIYMNHENFM